MKDWDLYRLRKIAGIQLTEGWDADSDDDEDPDVAIAMSDKRQAAFEKKNKKELKAAEDSTPKKSAKEEPKKEEPKKEESKAKAEEPKKEESKAEEAKRRGRAPNAESFNQHAKAQAKSMTRKEFLAWAADKHGKGKAYASALFAKYNPKSARELKEAKVGWILVHPHMPSFTLAENYELKSYQWIDSASDLNTVVHLSEEAARKTAQYMSEWRGQSSVVEKVVFEN